jgi:hypothetical protein
MYLGMSKECLKGKMLGMSKKVSGKVNNGRNLTSWEFRGNFVGKTWEKLGTFSNGFQRVTKRFGNFVGITWE